MALHLLLCIAFFSSSALSVLHFALVCTESKAFQEAFPRVAHQLCAWHFWRDMAAVMKFGLTAAEGRDLTNKIANHFWRIVKCSPCPQGREEVIYHITCIAQLLGVINDDETGTQRTVIEEREFQFATVVAKLRGANSCFRVV